MPSDTYYLTQEPSDSASEFNSQEFLIRRMLARGVWTATLVKVMAVYPAAVGALNGTQGLVDVQPLVNQIDGQGSPTPHGTIHGVPYLRLQGGTSAIIMDPIVGDIGIAIFASRDISKVVTTQAQANPGSFRQFDPADALYVGGFLNGAPVRYVQFTTDGMIILDPTKITLQAPTVAVQGDLTVSGSVVAQGDVTGEGISLHTHVHGEVQTGTGETGAPV